jgi:hypothetical protein
MDSARIPSGSGFAILVWNTFYCIVPASVSDPDPCGPVLIFNPGSGPVLSFFSWIRICIGNTDPDPGELKVAHQKKENDKFMLKRSLTLFIMCRIILFQPHSA